jgi:hypothetical protein
MGARAKAPKHRREARLKAWAVAKARWWGIVVAKMTDCDGIPDSIFFVPGGRPIVVEFKEEGETGAGLQEATQPWYHAKLKELGYRMYRCDTKEAFLKVMEKYAK